LDFHGLFRRVYPADLPKTDICGPVSPFFYATISELWAFGLPYCPQPFKLQVGFRRRRVGEMPLYPRLQNSLMIIVLTGQKG